MIPAPPDGLDIPLMLGVALSPSYSRHHRLVLSLGNLIFTQIKSFRQSDFMLSSSSFLLPLPFPDYPS